ncbi:hypothetical protein BC938DRAFT_476057, partial [Jimgerdemannia flammicorona]
NTPITALFTFTQSTLCSLLALLPNPPFPPYPKPTLLPRNTMAKGFWGKAVTGIVALIIVTCIVLFFVFNKPIMEAVCRATSPASRRLRDPRCVHHNHVHPATRRIYGALLRERLRIRFSNGHVPYCRRVVRIFKWTKYVERFTKSDDRYLAMEEAVEEGGFGIILLIRLSPIPFSIQNAFFAIIPKVKFWQFGLATLLAVWKLVVDVWIGSTLANLADPKLDPTARAVSYAYIGGGVLFLAVAMWWIYRVTMRKVRAMALRRESKLASAQGAERNFVAEPMLRDGSRSPYEDEEFAVGGSNSNANITKPERVVLEEVEPYDERIMTPVSHIP